MAYQTITATNDKLKCGITVSCVSDGTAVGDITSVVVKKKYINGTWKVIKTVPITQMSDFTFTIFDPDTRSGFTYVYASIPTINGTEQVGVTAQCKCEFDGIFVSDDTGTWISLFNNDYSKMKNTQVSYITTLSGKFPKRVSNADTDYFTGSARGMFLPFDQCGKPVMEDWLIFKNGFLDMLANGHPKLLKTYDGNAWVISVDASPKEEFSEFIGASMISFDWTQIGEFDNPPVTTSYTDATSNFTINSNGKLVVTY